jgi:hypothetical protein
MSNILCIEVDVDSEVILVERDEAETVIIDITGGGGGGGGSSDWNDITNKPATFPPSQHNHVIADVTGLQVALDGKQASGSYAASTHTHAISDTTGLQTALDGKAASSHSHVVADVTGLQTALDGKQATIAAGTTSQYYRGDKTFQTLDKAAVGLSNVDNTADANKPISTAQQTALNAKANTSHSHIIGDVTGLQTALDGKAATSHTHTRSQITDFAHSHVIGDVTGLQTALDGKQASGSYAASTHTHAISDTTGLQTALDGKQKTITSGTASPSGGVDGDVYLQYT